MFERRFLMGCVSDFFYNLGYRTNKNAEHSESVKVANKHIKEDGYNDEFDMLYHFSRYKDEDIQQSTVAGFGTLDEEYIEKCERLYKVMIKDRRKDGFVPLYIDSRTGAGIYIIGCNRFHEETCGYSYRKKDDVCLVCVVNFSMLDIMESYNGMDRMPLEMSVEEFFRSVKKAFDFFIGFVSENEAYKNYPCENDDELPQKIDNDFNLFFISKKANAEIVRTAWEADYESRINAKIKKKEEMQKKSIDKYKKV